MIASLASAAFFPTSSSSSVVSAKASQPAAGEGPQNLGVRGIVAKPTLSSGAMVVKAQARAKGSLKSETHKVEEDSPSSARTIYNQLPDWSFLVAAITTLFLAAEKHFTLIDWKPRRPDVLAHAFGLGKIVQDSLVFRQNFSIRSYEIGADRTASIESLMNHLQEAALNHVKSIGLMDDGYGSTPEMSKRNLIWVVSKTQILVEKYPSWEDVVEIDTWVAALGKNGMRRDWHARDYRTGQTVIRATSMLVTMNKQTRRLSRIPEEVRSEIGSFVMNQGPILDKDTREFPKLEANTADHVRGGLTPRWGDLDVNQHVNNIKYVGWILESVPTTILESHELASITLKYKRECGRNSALQSLTTISDDDTGDSAKPGIECQHLLCLECGTEVLRGRTDWRPKRGQDLQLNQPIRDWSERMDAESN